MTAINQALAHIIRRNKQQQNNPTITAKTEGERKIEETKDNAKRMIVIIDYIENPQTGYLKVLSQRAILTTTVPAMIDP